MKKHLFLLTVLVLLFSLAPFAWAEEQSGDSEAVHDASIMMTDPVAWADEQSGDSDAVLDASFMQPDQATSGNSTAVLNASIMRPDEATRDKWYQEYLKAPKSYIDPDIKRRLLSTATKPLPLLLDHITYTPSERNQSSCGNCWVWAGTGLAETKHSVENGVKDRLSIQYFDSAFYVFPGGYYACNGGNLGTFVNFYNQRVFVPWSNYNAYFQDQAGGTAPHVAASSISISPNYDGNPYAIQAATIPTAGLSQATAILNIKNILNQNKAVEFNFWLANQADWNTFFDFWNNHNETEIWNPDPLCGHTQGTGNGGHAVVIVGYDDSDTNLANRYWLVLNSWGANAHRPNGLFRMKMYMDYSCFVSTAIPGSYYSRQFQNIETVYGRIPFFDTNALFMASKGASTNSIWFRERSTGGPWSIWSMMSGTTSQTPALATFNTKQYMVTKGATDTSIWIRSQYSSGAWSSWTSVVGTTDTAPALATYRNKLYLFVKQAGGNAVQYKSMSTSGVWSAWATVPGASTPYAPAVVVHNDLLHLFQTATDGKVYFKSMPSNEVWYSGWGLLNWSDDNMLTNAAPAVTVYDNRIHVVVKGLSGTLNANNISIISTDSNGYWYYWAEIPGAGRTTRAPQVGVGPDVKTFNVTVTGQSSTTLWTQTYVKGTGWASSWSRISGYSTGAPSLNTYWFRAEPYPTLPTLAPSEGKLSE